MDPNQQNMIPEKQGRRIGCGTVLFLVMVLGVAGMAYLLRPRWGAIWLAATGPAAGTAPPSKAEGQGERKILYWTCSMHPQYRSDKPGICPICKMELNPVYADSPKPETGALAERKVLYWTCPMHPQVKSDKQGVCPDCGMDLVPEYERGGAAATNLPEGAFRISAEKQQLIGVQYGEASIRPLSKTVRAVGRLAYDETRITHVHSKVTGWINRVYVDFTGEMVRKNQPLLTIYSPDLLSTQDEYLIALKARDQLGASAIKEVSSGAAALLDAARRRLELWDVTEEQIAELEKTRKPIKDITLFSTASGFVISRNAYERQRIMPESELYTLADLSTIWAIADIYEFEAPFIHLGQGISMTLPAFPGRTFYGKVAFISPQVENSTRTLKVRAEFVNPGFALKPDMYANIELKANIGRSLSVPAEAVLDSGSDQIVFVALDGGYFEPRKVQIGEKVEDRVIIRRGLNPGDRIVTSGNFLIDSESRLKSALSGMSLSGMPADGGSSAAAAASPEASPPKSGQDKAEKLPAAESRQKKPEPHRHD